MDIINNNFRDDEKTILKYKVETGKGLKLKKAKIIKELINIIMMNIGCIFYVVNIKKCIR